MRRDEPVSLGIAAFGTGLALLTAGVFDMAAQTVAEVDLPTATVEERSLGGMVALAASLVSAARNDASAPTAALEHGPRCVAFLAAPESVGDLEQRHRRWTRLIPHWYRGGVAMTLRLSDEENRQLDELAAAEGRSKQEIVRLALAERWARLQKEEQLGEVLGRVLPRYQGLLDRLGSA